MKKMIDAALTADETTQKLLLTLMSTIIKRDIEKEPDIPISKFVCQVFYAKKSFESHPVHRKRALRDALSAYLRVQWHRALWQHDRIHGCGNTLCFGRAIEPHMNDTESFLLSVIQGKKMDMPVYTPAYKV